MKPADIKAFAAIALTYWDAIARAIDPDYVVSGNEVQMLNPRRKDQKRGSFSFNLRTGMWMDFATGESGKDLVSLWAYCRGFTSQGKAADNLAAHLRMGNFSKVWVPVKSVPPVEKKPLAVVSSEGMACLVRSIRKLFHGRAVAIWVVRDIAGNPLYVRVRVENPGEDKKVLTMNWNVETREWEINGPAQWVLYGLETLGSDADCEVLLVEGERARDSAAIRLQNLLFLGFPGTGLAHIVDLEPLRGRRVTIWPDADEHGLKAASDLASRLSRMGVSVRVVELPEPILQWRKVGKTDPGGWDLADPCPAGLHEEDLYLLLETAKPWKENHV